MYGERYMGNMPKRNSSDSGISETSMDTGYIQGNVTNPLDPWNELDETNELQVNGVSPVHSFRSISTIKINSEAGSSSSLSGSDISTNDIKYFNLQIRLSNNKREIVKEQIIEKELATEEREKRNNELKNKEKAVENALKDEEEEEVIENELEDEADIYSDLEDEEIQNELQEIENELEELEDDIENNVEDEEQQFECNSEYCDSSVCSNFVIDEDALLESESESSLSISWPAWNNPELLVNEITSKDVIFRKAFLASESDLEESSSSSAIFSPASTSTSSSTSRLSNRHSSNSLESFKSENSENFESKPKICRVNSNGMMDVDVSVSRLSDKPMETSTPNEAEKIKKKSGNISNSMFQLTKSVSQSSLQKRVVPATQVNQHLRPIFEELKNLRCQKDDDAISLFPSDASVLELETTCSRNGITQKPSANFPNEDNLFKLPQGKPKRIFNSPPKPYQTVRLKLANLTQPTNRSSPSSPIQPNDRFTNRSNANSPTLPNNRFTNISNSKSPIRPHDGFTNRSNSNSPKHPPDIFINESSNLHISPPQNDFLTQFKGNEQTENKNSMGSTTVLFDSISEANDLYQCKQAVVIGQEMNRSMELYRVLCRNTKCTGKRCRYVHEVSTVLITEIEQADYTDIQNLSREVFECQHHRFFKKMVELIVENCRVRSDPATLINMIDAVLQLKHHEKTPFIGSIINALMNMNENSIDFKEAVQEILKTHGRRNAVLADILLCITVRQEKFLENHWDVIKDLTNYRENIDEGAIEDIMKESLEVDQIEYYKLVCEDLIFKDSVKFSQRFNQNILIAFYKKLVSHNLHQYTNVFLRKTPQNIMIDKINQVMDDDDLKALRDCLNGNNDPDTFIHLMFKNRFKHLCDHFTSYILGGTYSMEGLQMVHKFLIGSVFPKIYRQYGIDSADEEMKDLIALIAFNLMAAADVKKKPILVCQVVEYFYEDIHRLLRAKCFNDVYRTNLNTIPEKLIFIIKNLNRAQYFEKCFEFIQMKELDLQDLSIRALYSYKCSVIHKFILAVLENNVNIARNAILFFIERPTFRISSDLGIHYIFNKYILKIINHYPGLLLNEYDQCIKNHIDSVLPGILRGIIVLAYMNRRMDIVDTLWNLCASKDIYADLDGTEDRIILKSNLIDTEIRLIIERFLLKRLEKKATPSNISIMICVAEPPNATIKNFKDLLPNKFLECCVDQSSMMFRIQRTLKNYCAMDEENGLLLTYSGVKNLMEKLRRTLMS